MCQNKCATMPVQRWINYHPLTVTLETGEVCHQKTTLLTDLVPQPDTESLDFDTVWSP